MLPVIVLDTSFLVSFFLPSDENHEKALLMAADNKSEDMILSDMILHETLTVLNYKGGIKLAKEANEDLMRNHYVFFVRLKEEETKEILSMFFDQSKKLSVQDFSVIYLAKKTNSKVLAFDDKIVKSVNKKDI